MPMSPEAGMPQQHPMKPSPYFGRRNAMILAASGAAILQSFAAEAADKSQYTLFNPTPKELMREMSTDRPDKTESAYTVDAGHFQIESDLVAYTRDHDKEAGADTLMQSWSAAALNLKVGLCNRADFQLMIDTYNHVSIRDRVAGTRVRQSGFGDITTRLKVNMWGNDGGKTALAVMPFAKFPTNQDGLGNDAVEGGLIIPLAVELPMGWGMGVMTEFDFLEDATGGGDYHTDFVNTITFSHDLVGNLGFYVEFFSAVSTETNSEWIGTFDVGFTYAITEDVQLDFGLNVGVTDSADDLNPFLGLSWRF